MRMKSEIIAVVMVVLMSGILAAAAKQDSVSTSTSGAVEKMEDTKTNIPLEATLVRLETSKGPVTIWLYDDTPKHKENFIKLVKDGYYDGVLFHRVIKDFMVQTGDPQSKTALPGERLGGGSPDYTIEAEILYPRHYHKYGALAAARTSDAVNPEKRSSGSQFYIVTGKKYGESELGRMVSHSVMPERQKRFQELCMANDDSISSMQRRGDREGLEKLRQQMIAQVEKEVPAPQLDENLIHDYTTIGGTPHLDGAYTVFGEVVEGMDVVESIQNVSTDSSDRPEEDIRVIKAEVIERR